MSLRPEKCLCRFRLAAGVAAVAAAVLTSASASAAIVYSYTVVPTGASTASVYVTETLTNGSTSLVGAGLDGAAFKVTRTAGTGATIADAGFNAAFDAGPPFNSRTVTATVASLTEATGFSSPAISFASGRALVGTLTFAAGTGSGATTFQIAPYDSSGGYVVTRDGTYLDAASPNFTQLGTSTFNVTVPEPATFAATAGLAAIAVRRRRRGC